MAFISIPFSRIRRWLARPVFEDVGVHRPFRLRRASLLLLIGGWATFLVSCLIGHWLVRHQVRLCGVAELWHDGDPAGMPVLQWARQWTEAMGAASFFAGLGSVSLFDQRDRIPIWRAD